ncbi:hypothetical protein HMPREF0653_01626 [Prevotella disiens JCM 6334 = ATCC 29426]|uniref:Uncharacterized protein n=1 Tax=Prevotella disiens JCM 6334 = ATCC 29426 TaxID=1235811 RepID=A0ABN0NRE1_9BACT|nr:hypothetical protein HMPREF0653_01626 [Prevotella disiens JCM 6334 = ATCC 29426]
MSIFLQSQMSQTGQICPTCLFVKSCAAISLCKDSKTSKTKTW